MFSSLNDFKHIMKAKNGVRLSLVKLIAANIPVTFLM